MKIKNTDDLMESLSASDNLDSYMKENEDSLIQESLSDYLDRLLAQKKKTKSEVIHACECVEVTGYQIFSGTRNPSRNKLIAFAFGLELNLEETNKMLKFAGFLPLYPKSKRDSILIYAIQHQENFLKVNERLYDAGEETL